MKNKPKILLFSFVSVFATSCVGILNSHTPNNKNNEILSFSHIGETATNLLIENLESINESPIHLENNYSSLYFKNLNANFGNNAYGTCSYVAIGMLLSFYDSYWDDSFITETYEVIAQFQSDRQYLADFDLIPSDIGSPGIAFEPNDLVGNLTISEYYQLVSTYSNVYFQFKLIDLAMTQFGSAKFDENDGSLGMTGGEIHNFLASYIINQTSIATEKVTINSAMFAFDPFARAVMINKIIDGTPVILRAKQSNSSFAHAMIAYDYDSNSNEIYVHTGWMNQATGSTLTHVALSDLPYDELLDFFYIDLSDSYAHSHALNYRSSMNEDLCSCSYACPRELELTYGNYGDALPTYKWMSLHKEKWFSNNDLRFELSILDGNMVSRHCVNRISANVYEFSKEEWDIVRCEINDRNYYILLFIDDQSNFIGSDEYWCRKLFSKPADYQTAFYVKPNEYGFADAYPSDETTATTFINHIAHNGGTFQTRRYRTGYIHNEYIVMSCVRLGYNEAYIVYHFDNPIWKIDVELAHWRELSNELFDSYSGKFVIERFSGNEWKENFNLLYVDDLTRDRTRPKTYQIAFEQPTNYVRFYAKYNFTPPDNNNRGRICIGNLAYYEYGGMPLSGYELDYNEDIWTGTAQLNNCYGYALNNQVEPGTNDIFLGMPGAYSNTALNTFGKEDIKRAVSNDFAKYNFTYGRNLIFKEVGKYEVLPEGTYRVALISGPLDFHWYRQDSDGYWSHKLGITPVKRTDDIGNFIVDPEICARDRVKYPNFLGYYAVTPWNNLYAS